MCLLKKLNDPLINGCSFILNNFVLSSFSKILYKSSSIGISLGFLNFFPVIYNVLSSNVIPLFL